MRLLTIAAVAAALAALAIPVVAQDSPWRIEFLPGDPSWVWSEPADINESGLICGNWGLGWETSHAVLWKDGTYIDIANTYGAPPGWPYSSAGSIDRNGRVGGSVSSTDYDDPALRDMAIVWDSVAGTYEVVHPEGEPLDNSRIWHLTDNGLAVGDLLDDYYGTRQLGYFWDLEAGTGHVLALVEGLDSSAAAGVNQAGVAVGWAHDGLYGAISHAVLWPGDGTVVDLHPLLRAEDPTIHMSRAYAITEEGVVSGLVWDENLGQGWGWLWKESDGFTFLGRGPDGSGVANAFAGRLVSGWVGQWDSGTTQGAVWVDGIFHAIPRVPGYDNFGLDGINARGVAIGSAVLEGLGYSWWQGSRAFVAEPREDDDFDGDGLNDSWELLGYEHDNGVPVDLFGMGANPLRRDLFVEIDSMVGGGYDHRPDAETLQPVIDAFAAHDIALHIHIDDDLPFDGELGTLDGLGRYQWDEFDALKTEYFAEELESAVRYCVFGHRLATLTDSGLARGEPSADFIVSLGAFVEQSGSTDPWMQAGTFMHELGHVLGLRHGGADVNNNKPNYLSVMNYDYQKQGLRVDGEDGHFDYSRVKLANLDEGALLEPVGLGIQPLVAGHQTLYRVVTLDPVTFQVTVVAVWSGEVQGSIDWNGSGAIDGATVSADINGNGSTEMLTGHHDWAALDFKGGTVGFGVGLPPPPPPPETEVVEELTVEEAKLIPPSAVEGLIGRAGRGSVRLSWTAVGPYGQGVYRVYRWSSAQERRLVAETQASLMSDRPGSGTWTYVVTVTDMVGATSVDSQRLAVRVR